jgi:hypothetical protein
MAARGNDGPPRRSEDQMMIRQFGRPRDPFEGRGARRRQLRLRIEGVVAIGLAIAACGMVAAMWLRTLAPLVERLGFG